MAKSKKTVLVTGGAGYIGSHTVQRLQQSGYQVIVLDNLIYGHREFVEEVLQVPLIVGNIADTGLLQNIFATYPIEAVIHFAAYAYVGESVQNPTKYYRNNVAGTLALLEAMVKTKLLTLAFTIASSSA
ncbi:MAG: UDP-glucose 4-epimerase, partial [Leptolyngbya sp. SIO4C5]|nr:UDP-glucose 4-epimerase [Leptolyngbya sp. SIO4C5]